MTPKLKIEKHIDVLCVYCGTRKVKSGESLCFDCEEKIRNEKVSWISKSIIDNRQLWLPGFEE